MKQFFRCLSIILVAVMLLSIPALAAENRASSYIMSTCVYLNLITSTEFRIWHEVIALDIMDELGAYEIKVQESTDGSTWRTVRTFNCANYPSMVDQNTHAYANYLTYTGTVGRLYRARIIMFAENSTGRGEVIVYTEPVRIISASMT